MILPEVVARQLAIQNSLLVAQNQPYTLRISDRFVPADPALASDPGSASRVLFLALVGALFGGLSVLGTTALRSPGILLDALAELGSSRVGPLTRLLLAPLFVGASLLLPLVALFVGAADAFAFAGAAALRGDHALEALRRRLGDFARHARGLARTSVRDALADPGRLGWPV